MLRFFLFISFCVFTLLLSSQTIQIDAFPDDEHTMTEWAANDDPRVYEGDRLFDLINGGAEIYHEYGFDRVTHSEYINQQGSMIQLDVFEMSDDAAAWGIYSMNENHALPKVNLGDAGRQGPDYLMFRQANRYITISVSPSGEASSAAMNWLGKQLEQVIGRKGMEPLIIQNLPDDYHAIKRVYIRGNLALSNLYYFGHKDIFSIEEAVMLDDGKDKLLVFSYENQTVAAKTYSEVKSNLSVSKRFSGFSEYDEYFSLTDRKQKPLFLKQYKDFILVGIGESGLDKLEEFISLSIQ